ncbi:hypothetical protein CPC08DRAFT_822345 [Agrocybe pediades]|nr:hypothetical protein CPC08DRAFT_822345 [Agrocybe pediades]
MRLVDLPPEIITEVFLFLSPADILNFRLTHRLFNLIFWECLLVQYTSLLEETNLEDNPCAPISISEKLEELKHAGRAWDLARPEFSTRLPVIHHQSGVYDLTGGVYLLSNDTRTAMHYLRLPRKKEDVPEWKIIKSAASIIDIGLCLFEHDMIVNVTTVPYRESVHSPLTYNIGMDILQFSTGKPHPDATQPYILVLNSTGEKPAVGIEIVGEHLVLILCYYTPGNNLEDNIFVYEWKTGMVKMHFTAESKTYSGLLFLTEDLILLPNALLNTLDIFRIPEKATVETPKPVLRLSLPRLANGRHLGGISCRAEPNPIGKSSKFGQTVTPTNDDETAIGGPSSSDSRPKRAFLPKSSDAICVFDLRYLILQMMFVEGVGMNMHMRSRHRFTFIVHRSALIQLAEKWGDGKWELEEAERVAKREEERRQAREEKKKAEVEQAELRREISKVWDEKKREVQGGQPVAGPSQAVDDIYADMPDLQEVEEDSDDFLGSSDDDHDSRDDEREPSNGVPYRQWGYEITRWFNSDSVGTHWITTTAGERSVRMSDSERHETHPYTILDFNQEKVKKVKRWLQKKEEEKKRLEEEKKEEEEVAKLAKGKEPESPDAGKGKGKQKDTGTTPGPVCPTTTCSRTAEQHGDNEDDEMPGLKSITPSPPSLDTGVGVPPGPSTSDTVTHQVDLELPHQDLLQLLLAAAGAGGANVQTGDNHPADIEMTDDEDEDEWEDMDEDEDTDQEDEVDGHPLQIPFQIPVPWNGFADWQQAMHTTQGQVASDLQRRREDIERRRLEMEKRNEAYTSVPNDRIRVEDTMGQVRPQEVFDEPVIGALPYVAVTTERCYPFNGILLDEERVLGVKTDGMTGDIRDVTVHYYG